jgi:glycosyltransferase involved in cell wall biosynthesis
VVYNLSEALTLFGHDVTVFASGDSQVTGRLVPSCPAALRLGKVKDHLAPHLLMFEQVRALAPEFDIIHFHTEYVHFSLARALGVATVSTMHGRLDSPECAALFREFSDLPLVSISLHQRGPLPNQNWVGVVPHGLNRKAIAFSDAPTDYLAFLGRISPEKGVEHAVAIAKRVGMKLRVAAKVDSADEEYFQSIKTIFDHPLVEFIGEIGDRDKAAFLGGAVAVLFPVQWPEPFGLVMIESLAAGTPVIAFRAGSVPEVIRHGVSGFIVETVDEACAAVRAIMNREAICRRDCRHQFEERFCAERMARDYLKIYERLIEERRSRHATTKGGALTLPRTSQPATIQKTNQNQRGRS